MSYTIRDEDMATVINGLRTAADFWEGQAWDGNQFCLANAERLSRLADEIEREDL